MEGTVTKSLSVRSAERNRIAKVKVKPEPRSIPELTQDLALLREQTVDFFVNIRGLPNKGLNPKSVVDTAVVTAEDLEEVWGKVSAYRTTNTKLHPDTRRELVTLYGKIYGTEDVTNNEFMLWVVKGFILECKDEDVDWATAAASTAREKADRCQRELDKCRFIESGLGCGGNSQGSAGASGGSPPVYSFVSKGGKSSTKLGIGKRSASNTLTKFSSGVSEERRPVSQADLAAVQDVLQSEIESLHSANMRLSLLVEARKKEADQIIGLRYSMDDRKSAARESEETVKGIESSLLSIDAQISGIMKAVIAVQGDGGSSANGEALLLQMNALKGERERNARKLEIARFALEENSRRAVQGEEMYQNAEIGLWKSNSEFKILERQITEMARRRAAIEEQIKSMNEGGGVSLCPRPVPHGTSEWEDIQLEIQPCSFCNGHFSFFDVVVASCRHLYHPFCIVSLCGKQNRCVTCAETFHPSWWRSFGFRNLEEEFPDTAVQLDFTDVKKEGKLTVEDNSGIPVTNWSDKQSDLGSSGSTLQGKKGETEPGAPMMPSVSEGPENGFRVTSVGEEVNSPVKKPRVSKSPVKKSDVQACPVTGNCDAAVLLQGVGSDAQPSSTVVPLAHEWAAEEDFRKEENSVGAEGGQQEDEPNKNSETNPAIALRKTQRYSFSTRQESGPLDEGAPNGKTISLSLVCPVLTPTGAKRKGIQKTEEDANRKTLSRKNDNKRAELEASETGAETTTARVTRSSKNQHIR